MSSAACHFVPSTNTLEHWLGRVSTGRFWLARAHAGNAQWGFVGGAHGARARAGLPAITVPCGFEAPRDGGGGPLPVGLQIIGRAFGEADMISVAHVFEQTADFAWGSPPA
jgi:hypothetical protein